MRIPLSIDRCRVPPEDIREKELSIFETVSDIFVEKEISRLSSCRKGALELAIKIIGSVSPIG